jgi:hypothetical protein
MAIFTFRSVSAGSECFTGTVFMVDALPGTVSTGTRYTKF